VPIPFSCNICRRSYKFVTTRIQCFRSTALTIRQTDALPELMYDTTNKKILLFYLRKLTKVQVSKQKLWSRCVIGCDNLTEATALRYDSPKNLTHTRGTILQWFQFVCFIIFLLRKGLVLRFHKDNVKMILSTVDEHRIHDQLILFSTSLCIYSRTKKWPVF